MQPLTGFQIELIDDAGDRGDRARTQRLFHGPERVFALRRLGEDQPARIETERAEAMPIRPAVIAQAVSGQDEEKLFPPPTRAALARARVHACWGRVGWGGAR
jgi:hypothetical protein